MGCREECFLPSDFLLLANASSQLIEPWFYFADSAKFTEFNRFEEIEYVQHQQHQQFIKRIHTVSLPQPPLQQKQTKLTGKTPHNLTPPATTTTETDQTHR